MRVYIMQVKDHCHGNPYKTLNVSRVKGPVDNAVM